MTRSEPLSRRRLLAGAAAIAGVPLLSGCNAGPSSKSSSGGSAPGAGTVTLTVMFGAEDLSKEQIADFEAKNPGIKIQLLEYDLARLNAMLASGNPPDITISAAVGSANTNARGLATDLTPYLDKSQVLKKDDLQPVNESFRWDGTKIGQGPYYGIVKDWSQDATLWYNTALFDKAKVPYLSDTEPTTYDELLAIAKRLTVKDGGKTLVFGLGLEWAWSLISPIATMVLQQGAQLFNEDLTEIDFTTPAARRAIQWYVDFGEAGVGPTSLNPLPDGSDMSTFSAKRMAITQDGYWFGGNFVDNKEINGSIRMAPAPIMGDKRVSPSYSGQGAWIPAEAKHKDEAWKLMEYFLAGPPAEKRATSGWGIPGLKSLASKLPQDLPYQKQAYTVAQNELQYAVPLPESPYVTTDACNVALDKQLQRAIKKEQTVDAACAAATAEINKLLKQGKEQIG
ncbi:ABC transporter substrate-binding protein [Nonomuraea sp. 10N515B]|uniref:ABC transporter substrate-binding protein n=1 Tax=Nonomuraea sp. 10N515B TaxID=3457422 RepID=UPI003FCEE5BE